MGKYTYIHRDATGLVTHDAPLTYEPKVEKDGTITGGHVIGETYEDYLACAWIPLKKKQMEFYRENPTASWKEVIEMQLMPPPPEPAIEDVKEAAIQEIVVSKRSVLDEQYPVRDILDNVIKAMLAENESDTEAIISYLEEYKTTREALKDAADVAIGNIREAECVNEIATIKDDFRVAEISQLVDAVRRPREFMEEGADPKIVNPVVNPVTVDNNFRS